jgi:hypothetical protein
MTQEQIPMFQSLNPRYNTTVFEARRLVKVLTDFGLPPDELVANPAVAAPGIPELPEKLLDIHDVPLYLNVRYGTQRYNVGLLLRVLSQYREPPLLTAKMLYDLLTNTPGEFSEHLLALPYVRQAVDNALRAHVFAEPA